MTATGTNTATSSGVSVAIGLGAGTGVGAEAVIGSGAIVSATVGEHAVLRATGAVDVSATATDKASATGNGGAGGGISISAMIPKAEDRGGASAAFDGDLLGAASLSVTAESQNQAIADLLTVAIGLGAGAGGSACATVGGASTEGNCTLVHSDSGTGGAVTATIGGTPPSPASARRSTSVRRTRRPRRRPPRAAAAVAWPSASSTAMPRCAARPRPSVAAGATIGTATSRSAALSVTADDTSTATSTSILGAGGVVAGGGSYANSTVTPTVRAFIGTAGTTQGIHLSGDLEITAVSHRAESNATAKSYGGGGVQVGVARSVVTTNPTVTAYLARGVDARIGGSATVKAESRSDSGTGPLPDTYVANGQHQERAPGGLPGDIVNVANVNLTTNTVYFQSHGLQTGDTVLYVGTSIGGLGRRPASTR